MKPLTAKQYDILKMIWGMGDYQSYPPTRKELAAEFHMTVKGMHDHIKAIERKGYLQTEYNISRGLVLTESGLCILGKKPWPSKKVRKIKPEKYMKVDELKSKVTVKAKKEKTK